MVMMCTSKSRPFHRRDRRVRRESKDLNRKARQDCAKYAEKSDPILSSFSPVFLRDFCDAFACFAVKKLFSAISALTLRSLRLKAFLALLALFFVRQRSIHIQQAFRQIRLNAPVLEINPHQKFL